VGAHVLEPAPTMRKVRPGSTTVTLPSLGRKRVTTVSGWFSSYLSAV
jgi:hypothetical protein